MNQKETKEHNETNKQQEDDAFKVLRDNRGLLVKRHDRIQLTSEVLLYFSSGFIVILPLILLVVMKKNYSLYGTMAGLFFVFGLIFLFGALWLRSRHRSIDSEIEDLDFQIYLQQMAGSSDTEKWAERQLRYNVLQLRRHYEQNLGQNEWTFYLGVLCIFLGIGVISATFYLVLQVAKPLGPQIITGAVGGIGAVLTNYIAAIYLRMHSSTNENLAKFHSKLVDTQKILLANLIASRINDTQKREETMEKLAIALLQESGDIGSANKQTKAP